MPTWRPCAQDSCFKSIDSLEALPPNPHSARVMVLAAPNPLNAPHLA